jgi:hypothetical protein
VQLDYAFDRLRATKLAHAYEILVPTRARPFDATMKERLPADGSDLRTGLVGAATRFAHDYEPDGGRDRAAIFAIKCPRSVGNRGRPCGIDFQRQNKRNPFRCHRMSVSGFTTVRS